MMKQPALGRKILELRQEKGLTQEELVEQCNISVRTIQRIEAGEVTPRSYTVRTILDALDYDLALLNEQEHIAKTEIKELLLLDVEDTKEAGYLNIHLNMAWIAGIIFFIATIPEIYADYMLIAEDERVFNDVIYVILKVAVMASYVLFLRGLILTGKIFQNYLLKISALLMLVLGVVFYLSDIISLFMEVTDHSYLFVTESICYGLVGIVFGIGLLRLKGALKTLGKVAGILEIIAAGTFLTIILSPLGLLVWTAAIIIEIIILFKVLELLKTKLKEL